MRKAALFALACLSTPALRAAVLPGPQKAQITQVSSSPVGLRSLISAPSAALVSQSAQSAATRGEWTADTRNTWRDDDGEPRVQFNLRTGAGDSRWGFGVRLRDLTGPAFSRRRQHGQRRPVHLDARGRHVPLQRIVRSGPRQRHLHVHAGSDLRHQHGRLPATRTSPSTTSSGSR